MKRKTSLLFTTVLAVLFVFIMAGSVFADSQETGTMKMGKVAGTSVTVEWNFPDDPNYTVLGYGLYDIDEKELGIFSADVNSATITGLKKGYVKDWIVICVKEDKGGNVISDDFAYTTVNTTPAQVAKAKFQLGTIANKSTSFYVAQNTNVTGYQAQLYKVNPLKLVTTVKWTGSNSKKVTITRNIAYKYRVRAYYTNPDTNVTSYGAWSYYKYFDNPNITGTSVAGKVGVTLKFKGVKGVTKYKVYVSTSRNKLGKLTKTVTAPAYGKSKKISVNKHGSVKMKRGTAYYVNVVPYIKSNGTLYKSEVYSQIYA